MLNMILLFFTLFKNINCENNIEKCHRFELGNSILDPYISFHSTNQKPHNHPYWDKEGFKCESKMACHISYYFGQKLIYFIIFLN